MLRAYFIALCQAVTIALSIAVVIAFAAVGCAMRQHDSYKHNAVKGVRAPIASYVLAR
jgi:hypothetical protein